ncbi:hypothetical protein LJB99_04845 [Deltaproteobacteria bacterium OttesenSCG-928-K17]|nr:hypothetical protein [Deltaproteobacteria bacterium OttesenSCG-928-K17]
MKVKLLTALFGLMMAVAAPVQAQPTLTQYQDIPFWLDGQTIPHVLLVLERDWKMFYPAYNNLADLDGDGALDIGFNPAVTYVGYFDSDSCYKYENDDKSANSTGEGVFVRVGPVNKLTQADYDDLYNDYATSVVKSSHLTYPYSKHGVCDRSQATNEGTGQWHGNWLNYAMTGRMDAIRKVLYGGKRYIDDVDKTVLEMTYLPPNSHSWGGEIYSDEMWVKYAPSSPWFDVPSFIGYTKPGETHVGSPINKNVPNMHFWARTSYHWTGTGTGYIRKSDIPLFRFVANVPSENRHPYLKTPMRIWDWIGDHGPGALPYDYNLMYAWGNTSGYYGNKYTGKLANRVARNFSARVEVCQAGNIGPDENCRIYGTSNKPIGLLQEYGESEKMFFGLLTGTVNFRSGDPNHGGKDGGTRYMGGVVRHHIQPFSNYINISTGQIKLSGGTPPKREGLIATIDAFEVTGINNTTRLYSDGSQAGNPLGEMLWEGTRYLIGGGSKPGAIKATYEASGGLQPSSDFYPSYGGEVKLPDQNRNLYNLPILKEWAERPALTGMAEQCPKPVILAISEVFPDHDWDNYPNQSDFAGVPRMTFAKGSESEVPDAFSLTGYLDLITKHEKLTTATAGNKLFFYPDNRGLCTAKVLNNGLSDIVGHCPSEPSLKGSYSIAAVAYYAHTHNFAPMAGVDNAERNIDFYAVGIAGNFPDITLTVSDSKSFTLMPITAATSGGTSTAGLGAADDELKTLINFFIEYWLTDDGHTYDDGGITKIRKIPYKVKFSTNFEYTTTPSYTTGGGSNNMERDIFNTFEITLLTTKDTNSNYREAVPVFINSGSYKTNPIKWAADKASGNYNSQTYYYAFKRPAKGTPFDISQFESNIVGVAIHTDSFGSGYGIGGLGGYTITGVTHPGAYLDTGLYGYDYPLTFTSGYFPSGTDVPVPLEPDGVGIPGQYHNYDLGNHPGYHMVQYCQYYHRPTMRDPLLTPAECPYAGYHFGDNWSTEPELSLAYPIQPDETKVCGTGAISTNYVGDTTAFKTSKMRYVQVRSFKFEEGANRPANLPNPMWLAAKYGGFKDYDNDGKPSADREWKRTDAGVGYGDPLNYFGVANMSQLPDQLGEAFESIANSVATGTANASSINSTLGGGVSIQTQYRTEHDDGINKIRWPGSVYAFFVDKWGNLRADTNGDGMLNLVTSPRDEDWSTIYKIPNPGVPIGDLIVHVVSPPSGSAVASVYLCRDIYGNNNGESDLPNGPGQVPPVDYPPNADCQRQDSLDAVPALWNTAQQISDMNVDDRNLYTYWLDDIKDETSGKAWSPKNLTGFEFKVGNVEKIYKYMGLRQNGSSIRPEAEAKDLAEKLITYTRGEDLPGYRKRTAKLPWDSSGTPKVWRMGDVINSRPIIVGVPSSNYHISYGDQTYATYREEQARRRQVAYFGSNDGIFHAVNVGYFGSLKNGLAGYSTSPDPDAPETNPIPLGAEMWGFIPPSVLPHLKWVADETYQHGYTIDLTPHIVDVHNGTEWRTIMIVGLRQGARPMSRYVSSAIEVWNSAPEYFAMDVTDPNGPPTLLWTFSHPDLGMTTAKPTIVRQGNNWYVVLPSGPAQTYYDEWRKNNQSYTDDAGHEVYDGKSNQKARVFVLKALTGEYARERDRDPESFKNVPDPLMAEEPKSFFGDAFLPKAAIHEKDSVTGDVTWSHHAVYLGLTSIDGSNNDSGAVYRIQMMTDGGQPMNVDSWKLRRLYKTDKPVTAAVNTTFDRLGNRWVLFGTGRVWSKRDLTPCGPEIYDSSDPTKPPYVQPASCAACYEQYLFGLKEPYVIKPDNVDPSISRQYMTFDEIVDGSSPPLVDVSGIKVYASGHLQPEVNATGKTMYEAYYASMLQKDSFNAPLFSGWKRKMPRTPGVYTSQAVNVYELVNTQVKLDALSTGRVNAVVSAYLPSNNICDPMGESGFYVYDSSTGLPAPYMLSYGGVAGTVINVDINGTSTPTTEVTGALPIGAGMSAEVVIIPGKYIGQGASGQRPAFIVDDNQNLTAGFISWQEVFDMGFDLKEDSDKLYDYLQM